MPKLWSETIESHRRDVREAVVATTAGLVAAHGLHAVTMSRVAELSGIGRATLYKYFPDVGSILQDWHKRQIADHLARLTTVRARDGDAGARLAAVLQAYAVLTYETARAGHGGALAALVHQGAHVARAEEQLQRFIAELLADAAASGAVRTDVGVDELAGYCLHALGGASGLASKRAVERLVGVTLAGLAPRATPTAAR
jgi:AcrR family transcriptional regulator